jgi:hypothetical protein
VLKSSTLAFGTLLLFLALGALPALGAPQTLVAAGESWRYLDDGSDQGTAWRNPGFDDSGWAEGPAQLGFSEGDEATLIDGPNQDRHITFYFRHAFSVSSPGFYDGLTVSLLRDDGALVYLNGTEIFRSNMPGGPIDSETTAVSNVGGADEDTFFEAPVDPALLTQGQNVIAVEVHQQSAASADLSFDLSLEASLPPDPPVLLRGPYLQNALETSVVVRWRTDLPGTGEVRFGPAPDDLPNLVVGGGVSIEHEITVAGLEPATRYYYSVATSGETLAGADDDHWFVTPPASGTRTPVRIWILGDSGDCGVSQGGCENVAAVQQAYFDLVGTQTAQVWLMLGDNAYVQGTDAEYTAGLFQPFASVLRNTVLWPAPGNHEFGASDSPSQSGPYYQAFTMPILGEAGGVPSGTEAYYSFDYGNVHFASLDSHDTDRSVGGLMWSWLEADLMATNQDWVIVYWHHPPYTKGSHDSDDPLDSEGKLFEMRENFVPLLDAHGVDLQLTGHSHSYERSRLIDGHYGTSNTFDPALHEIDGGDGSPNGDGAYLKGSLGPAAHEGTVYSVVGSSSKNSGGLTTHPVMEVGINFEGSVLVDVSGRFLEARFIDMNGGIGDFFRMEKGVPFCRNGIDDDGDGLTDYPFDTGCAHADDEWETDSLYPCDDGIDNDGDGDVDMADDGCPEPNWHSEQPECSDGLDNDGDGLVDHDGAGVGDPDPSCFGDPAGTYEGVFDSRCGVGYQYAMLPPLALSLGIRLRRRRH